MKDARKYYQELKDLMVDLGEAINGDDTEKFESCINECRIVMDDIEEAYQQK